MKPPPGLSVPLRMLARLSGWAGLLLLLWELYQAWLRYNRKVPGNLSLECRAPEYRMDAWTEFELTGCGSIGLYDARAFGVHNPNATWRTYVQNNGARPVFGPGVTSIRVAAIYGKPRGQVGVMEADQPLWMPQPRPALSADQAMERALDPMSRPVGDPVAYPPPPYWALPYRQERPDRDPEEQPRRGDELPLDRTVPGKHEVIEFPLAPRPSQPAPQRAPAPDVRPGLPEETLPGWVAKPGQGDVPRLGTDAATSPRPTVGVPPTTAPPPAVAPPRAPPFPPIRTENPPGSAGPTIIVGGGPPVGPHRPKPPGKREKERKVKWTGRAARIGGRLRRGGDAVTEALDLLDCAFKALPKGVRWDVQRADWAAQRAAGAVPRPKDKVDVDLRPPEIALPGFSEGGIKFSAPLMGPQTNNKYATLGANYIQPLSPQDKAAAVYRHFDKMDIADFVDCAIGNEIGDQLIGRKSQIVNEAFLKNFKRRLVGIETGVTF